MVTDRQTAPSGTRPAFWGLCAAAVLCISSCADIWGFGELRNDPDGGGTGGAGVVPSGSGGSPAETGAAGMGMVAPEGTGGTGGVGGVGVAGAGGGETGGTGAGGVGSGGNGGAVGPGGSGGVSGPGVGGSGGGAGGAAGGAGASGGGGGGGTGGAPACVAGTNRCVAGGDLQTCSPTGTWQSTGTSTRELLTNPAFERGETGWSVSVAGEFDLVYPANGNGADNTPEIAAQSAPNLAWFGGYNRADDSATQSVVIPADASSITVSFYYAVFTRETTAAENDVMDVQLTAGTQTFPLAHFSDNTPVTTWTRFSMSLPTGLAGQTVTLRFRDTTNATVLTSFYIDTVSLQAVACP